MHRGMDNFAEDSVEDDGGITVDCGRPEYHNNRPRSPQPAKESFTYEHFPVVCPSCRGTGKIHADDENRLVSFVPVKDDRLKPSRIFWKMFLMFIIFACIAFPLAFFLIPRTVTIELLNITSKNISIPDNPKIVPYIIVQTGVKIVNGNYLRIQLYSVQLEVSWNRLILNTDTCQNVTVTVPARETAQHLIEIKMIFNGSAGTHLRDECAYGWKTFIPQKFVATAKVTYLGGTSEISVTKYPYVQCYDFSGLTSSRMRN